MTLAGKVRDWLAQQDGPRLASDIAVGANVDRPKMQAALTDMVKAGTVLASDEYPRRYSPGREVRVWRHTDAGSKRAAVRVSQARTNLKRATKHGTWEAYQMHRREQALARAVNPTPRQPRDPAKRAASQAKYEAKRQAERAVERAKTATVRLKVKPTTPKPAGKPVYREGRKLRVVDCSSVIENKAAAPTGETVEQWMKRTGQKPEKLALGQVNNPLRFVGDAATNRERQRNQRRASA